MTIDEEASMATKKNFKPSDLKGPVRRLYEEAAVRGIENKIYSLASIIEVSPRQLYRWFFFENQPRQKSEKAILDAIDKLTKKVPGPEVLETRSGRAGAKSAYRSPVPIDPRDPEVVQEKLRAIRIQALFEDIQKHLDPLERALIFEPRSGVTFWEGFVEVLDVIGKHRGVIRLPR
jgi:hypothetical protein